MGAPIGKILTYAVLGLWTLVCVFPLYWVAAASLKAEDAITGGPYYLPFADFTPSFGAWAFILTDRTENLLWRFFNSAVVGLVSTALTVTLGAMAVYGLSRFRGKGVLPERFGVDEHLPSNLAPDPPQGPRACGLNDA